MQKIQFLATVIALSLLSACTHTHSPWDDAYIMPSPGPDTGILDN